MSRWSDEQTDNPLLADDRNFYKLEKWTKDGTKVDRLLYAVGFLGPKRACPWCNVDLEKGSLAVVESVEQMNGSVRLKETKSGRVRTVALPLTVRDELKAHRLAQAQHMLKLGVRLGDDSFVCALEDGSPMQPTFITHEWLRSVKRTTLPRYRFHDLRHAHGTHMLASGTHIKVASERLGHSKVGITLDLYSHVLPGMQEDAAAKVDAAFKAAQKAGKTA